MACYGMSVTSLFGHTVKHNKKGSYGTVHITLIFNIIYAIK